MAVVVSYRIVLIVAFFFRYKYPRTLLFYHSDIKLAGKGHDSNYTNFEPQTRTLLVVYKFRYFLEIKDPQNGFGNVVSPPKVATAQPISFQVLRYLSGF